jgi:hypothetical protein
LAKYVKLITKTKEEKVSNDFSWGDEAKPTVNEFDGQIIGAMFVDNEYQGQKNAQLDLTIRVLDEDYDGKDRKGWYGTGNYKNIKVLDGGLRAGGGQFSETARLGILVNQVVGVLGVELPPSDEAEVWIGHTFHWVDGMKIGEVNPDAPQPDSTMLFPTDYIGYSEVEEDEEAANTEISDAILETLKSLSEGKEDDKVFPFNVILVTIGANYPSLKRDFIKGGRTELAALVKGGDLEEGTDANGRSGYRLAIAF